MPINSDRQIEKIITAGIEKDHAVGDNLYLRVKAGKQTARWIVKKSKAQPGQKRKQISRLIGIWPTMDLLDARVTARDVLAAFERGVDPDQVINTPASGEALPDDGFVSISPASTFREVAQRAFSNAKRTMRSEKHQKLWWNSLSKALDQFGDVRARDVTPDHIGRLLHRDWSRVPESSRRLAQRLEVIFELARGVGAVEPHAPSPVKAAIAALGKQVVKVSHHNSLPYAEAPEFYTRLSERSAMSAFTLRWIMLTAVRSIEARAMEWTEIDTDARTWKIPAERMKTSKVDKDVTHTVYLSDVHMDFLSEVRGITGGRGLVFPNSRGKVQSENVFRALFRRMGCVEMSGDQEQLTLTAHGMRTTFRTWFEEQTALDTRIAEQILSHSIGGAVERAYVRDARRTTLMRSALAEWCDYLLGRVTLEELNERYFGT